MDGREFGLSLKGLVFILIFVVLGILSSCVFDTGNWLAGGVMLVVLTLAAYLLPATALRSQTKHIINRVAMAAEIYHGAITYALMRRILKDLDVQIEPTLTDYQEKIQDPKFIREIIDEAREGVDN